jgi:hypothetical protein
LGVIQTADTLSPLEEDKIHLLNAIILGFAILLLGVPVIVK